MTFSVVRRRWADRDAALPGGHPRPDLRPRARGGGGARMRRRAGRDRARPGARAGAGGAGGAVGQRPLLLGTGRRGPQRAPPVLGRAALVGIAATLAAALVPAREATRIPPGAALARATLEAGARLGTRRLALGRNGPGGAGCAILWLSERSVAWGFAGMLAVVGGAALLTPFVTLAVTALAAPGTNGSGAPEGGSGWRGPGARAWAPVHSGRLFGRRDGGKPRDEPSRCPRGSRPFQGKER